jgi:hypothetical protein
MSLDGSALADALVRHGLALCDREHVDLVDVSIMTTDGTSERVQFAISDSAEPIAAMSVELSDQVVDARTVTGSATPDVPQRVRPFTLGDLDGKSWSSFLRSPEIDDFAL